MTCFLKQKTPIDLQNELKPGGLFHLVSWVNPHTNKVDPAIQMCRGSETTFFNLCM